ncbi:MAG: TPM domain-containing protein [Thermoanaerobaculia bacterium]
MSRLRSCLLALVGTAGALMLSASGASAREIPYLSGRVVDEAGLLSSDARARIDARLAALEEAKGSQVAVLTIASLEGEDLADYSHRVAETWKLGRAKTNDGVLLLVARDDRKMRLEVGYGLEGAIPDAIAHRILDEIVRPRFREGDFGGGIEAGIEAVDKLVRGEPLPEPKAPSGRGVFITAPVLVLLVFLVIFLLTSSRRPPGRGGGGWRWSSGSGWGGSGWSVGSSGGSDWSSGGGGFSGGGGSFGGGGSSSGW